MDDDAINDKTKRNIEIRHEIGSLTKQLKLLKTEQKMNNIYIFKNCVHNWVLDNEYFQYDERPNRCTKCNLVKN
jgi:hypothetical protein